MGEDEAIFLNTRNPPPLVWSATPLRVPTQPGTFGFRVRRGIFGQDNGNVDISDDPDQGARLAEAGRPGDVFDSMD